MGRGALSAQGRLRFCGDGRAHIAGIAMVVHRRGSVSMRRTRCRIVGTGSSCPLRTMRTTGLGMWARVTPPDFTPRTTSVRHLVSLEGTGCGRG
jgi:hypothetical protein